MECQNNHMCLLGSLAEAWTMFTCRFLSCSSVSRTPGTILYPETEPLVHSRCTEAPCVHDRISVSVDVIQSVMIPFFYWIVQKKAKVRSRHIYVNANRTWTRILTLTGMCTLCKVSLYAFTRFLGLNIHAWLLTKQNDHKSKAPTNPAARKQNQTQQNQAIKHALTSYKKITFPRPTTPTHMLSRRQQQSTKPTFWWQFHWTLRYARWVPSCISSPFRCRRPECSCEEDK